MVHNFDLFGYTNKLINILGVSINILFFKYLIRIYCFFKGIYVGKGGIFNGFPRIYREPYSKIELGDYCRFNSSKNSIKIGLNRRCTLVTLSKNAEIIIGNNCGATGITIAAFSSVKIGNNVLMGAYCNIIDNDFHNPNPYKRSIHPIQKTPVIIEDNVFLGMNCTVLKGVTIGANSIIAANSVVFNNIPPNTFAMGNPCKLIVRRNWEESRNE